MTPIPDDLRTRMLSLGDQVQATLDHTGLDVLGFTILVQHPGGLSAESRSRVSEAEYDRALAAYLGNTG